MADRLTQLQDTVNQVSSLISYNEYFNKLINNFQQAEHFCNSVGILQLSAIPSKFAGFDRPGTDDRISSGGLKTGNSNSNPKVPPPPTEDYAQLFSTLIARTAKDIEQLIDSLPSEESSQELQFQSLKRLEKENQDAAENLEDMVAKGEQLLEKIQKCLADIASSQLEGVIKG